MKHIYFVVEGPHDVEVIGKFLDHRGMKRVKKIDDLDAYWHRLVPKFPVEGDLLKRVPVPVFFASQDMSIAVHSAGGVSQICDLVNTSFIALDPTPDALGILVDADNKGGQDRWQEIVKELSITDPGSGPGKIGAGVPRAGVFVLPDNVSNGTLEDLLLICAEKAYPTLLASARAFISPLRSNDTNIFCNKDERSHFSKPSGKSKAIAGCISSVLRPGKAIQVSIQDNRWFRDRGALMLPEVKELKTFVDTIIG